jgi:ATP-dependent DNA helicase HFM1/MER3
MLTSSRPAAHLVVIKGIRTFQNNTSVEYSDLDIMQMLGRAVGTMSTSLFNSNLPMSRADLNLVRIFLSCSSLAHLTSGIDKDGIAIILCEQELENKYRTLVQGKTILESSLHINLSEHLNSEIGLGTIADISSAKDWLRGSFLFQRIRKNPKYYALGKGDDQTWEDRVEDLVIQSVAKLRETQLIEGGDDDRNEELVSTEYGDIMSKVGD